MFDKHAVDDYRSITAPDALRDRVFRAADKPKRLPARIVSVVGVIAACLVLLLTMAVWAACGFVYGYFRAKMPAAVLSFHAVPFLCTLVYTVCVAVLFCGGDFNLGIEILGAPLTAENLALFSAMGMGLFSYIDSFIYGIIYLGNIGFYLDLVFMVLTFIVGFAIGKARRLKV